MFYMIAARNKVFLLTLAEAVLINYIGEDDAYYMAINRVLNPWLFDLSLYHAHIDLWCKIHYYLGYPRNHVTTQNA